VNDLRDKINMIRFDLIIYRQLKDLRGNYSEWEALFVSGIKR
jgi:hypothetical protein